MEVLPIEAMIGWSGWNAPAVDERYERRSMDLMFGKEQQGLMKDLDVLIVSEVHSQTSTKDLECARSETR